MLSIMRRVSVMTETEATLSSFVSAAARPYSSASSFVRSSSVRGSKPSSKALLYVSPVM